MSADNGIYIAQFPTCWRACYGAAIDNIHFYPKGSEKHLDILKSYFGDSPRFSKEQLAIDYARKLAEESDPTEYGLCILSGIWEEFDHEALVKDLAEVESEYNHEWYSLRNIKPTEMQLWAGDKRLVNIQGKWSDELETFIRMANLGIKAHQEEIKRRVESLLEKDFEGDTISDLVLEPRNPDLNHGRGNNAIITPIDESPFVPTGNEGITQIELCSVREDDDGSCIIIVFPDTVSDEDIDNGCHFYSVYKRHVDGRAIHMVDAPRGTKRHEAIATASKLARDFNVPFKDMIVHHVS